MKKFFIKTLGCKTNQVESALMSQILTSDNYEEVNSIEKADYYILNSCSVTHIADSKNISYIHRAKRENPEVKIVITGCMAQLEKEKLLENKEIDFVIGNYEKNDIAKILNNKENIKVSNIFEHNKFRNEKLYQTNRTRASVKIQDGCNNRCTYCTIPFARGKNRSNPIENVIEQINLFADNGYFETVLTGIHIGQWGYDFSPKLSLKNLLEEIEKSNIKRYRLGSLNPTELPFEFIDFLSQSKKFCPHFHLSLQSDCDRTLKNMNRHYTVEQIKNLTEYIDLKFKNAFIGCDIIAGFPDETDKDFETTYNNLSSIPLSRMHIFPYSRRKGTVADKMENQINEKTKQERCAKLQSISDKKLKLFFEKNINTTNEVIIEKRRDKKTNLLKGVTRNYINVLIDAKDDLKDTIQTVKITSFSNEKEKMIAKIVT
ncbi:tRNA (N(6)-L-threonylcarbamoyladenosine(37)-C(2))-methylthiotransferase MtaB [bacterium]|nr:tRNA (N(6)-L-threonylcarbamoyladenosine(37)-C(2))-methylthiotransferase MtaB [bacterium]